MTVRLDMVQDSHLPSSASVGMVFDSAVLEPISFQVPSSLNAILWQRLLPGKVEIVTTAGAGPWNALSQSADVTVARFRVIGNGGSSTAISFVSSETRVLSLSECDQYAENIVDATYDAVVDIS